MRLNVCEGRVTPDALQTHSFGKAQASQSQWRKTFDAISQNYVSSSVQQKVTSDYARNAHEPTDE